MELWHESLMKNKVVEVALQIRKKARETDENSKVATFNALEFKLLDVALALQTMQDDD